MKLSLRVYLEGPPHGLNMIAVKHLSILDDPRIKLCHDVSPKPLTHKKGYPLNQWSSAIACAALDYLSKFARKIENYAGLDPTQTRNTMSSHLYRINGAKINALLETKIAVRGSRAA
ncbi:hypothetical protein [Paenibacillus sp. BK720]|uniref:hypothetical protein n=1 Tax=Paenibacillus sp. BK720 TaxID=2587092 RepID=UPI001ABACD93|nr:hypothetical protein [Paenibacillus sp. BK720]